MYRTVYFVNKKYTDRNILFAGRPDNKKTLSGCEAPEEYQDRYLRVGMHFRRECTPNHGVDVMPETSRVVSGIGYLMVGVDHVSRDILKN